MSKPKIVAFNQVNKTYDGIHHVVKDLDLQIDDGEFLSLLGPSGSGKTTTLMMLAGFETPTSGEISIAGKLVNRVAPNKRGLAMVFQNYALFPHMTVEENVSYPLRIRSLDKQTISSKVQAALDKVKLRGVAGRHPSQLSGGQQQRVALARALVYEPRIVLMDEPLGALDKQLREHMQLELKSLHRELGITFVYVTHDQAEALTMSDRVAIFNDGCIQQIADVKTIYEQPESRFVAGFIGDTTMVVGKVTRASGSTCHVETTIGSPLTGVNVNHAKVGDEVACAIRPERLMISRTPCDNSIKGSVRDIIYYGDHLRVQCFVGGGQEASIKMPLAAEDPPAVGDIVYAHASSDHFRVYI